jgi:hypothetical protein
MAFDRPRGASWWAKRWGVHRSTAGRLLQHLHRSWGPKVVWKVGPQHALVATEASLQVVRVLRAERHLILVVPGETPLARQQPERDADDSVSGEQHARAIAEIWRALEALGAKRF